MISSDWRNHIPPPPQKKRWPKFGPNGPKSGQKLVFFASFLSLDHMFSLKLHTVIAYTEALHLVQVGIPKNSVGPKFGPIRPKSGPKSVFFLSFCQVLFISFPVNCLECQLGTLSSYKFSENILTVWIWASWA